MKLCTYLNSLPTQNVTVLDFFEFCIIFESVSNKAKRWSMRLLGSLFLAIILVVSAYLITAVVGQYDPTFLLAYALTNTTAGAGIAIDVMLATVVLYRSPDLSWQTWTLPITITHVSFPAFGYYGFWGASEALPWAMPVIGLLGAFIVGVFLLGTYCEWIGKEPFIDFPTIGKWTGISWLGSKIKPAGTLVNNIGLGVVFALLANVVAPEILAVSWDALASGPAKASIIEGWSTQAVLLSFLIAGFTVAIAATTSLWGAKRLRRIKFESVDTLARFIGLSRLAEMGVIGGFGVNSALRGFYAHASLLESMFISFAFFIIVTFYFSKAFWESARSEAEDAIGGHAAEAA